MAPQTSLPVVGVGLMHVNVAGEISCQLLQHAIIPERAMSMNRCLKALAGLFTGLTMSGPALAQSAGLPTRMVEEVMVKTTLLTLNDANLTGNYAVLFAKMAKPFRERFSTDTLMQAFKSFAGHHIDVIAAMPIVVSSDARIGNNGSLMLRGYFDTAPSRLSYQLDFAISEGEWKAIAIDVKVKDQSTSAAAPIDLLGRAAADYPDQGR